MEHTVAETRPPATRPLCASVSAENGESLAATASRVDHWLLIEYRHLWARDILGGCGFADEVKAHVAGQLQTLPNARLLFVRRPERRRADSFAVYVARSTERDRVAFGLEIGAYAELLDLDVEAVISGRTAASRLEHPLLVVCTHGKRDRCCAKFGRPLYEEVREEADPEWVWQSTHVGGDRFAGNLVSLPDGLYFGRVGRPEVWGLLDELFAGRIHLRHYRGRACYPFVVQAAERLVREEGGLAGIDDLTLLESTRTGEETWTIRLEAAADGRRYEVTVVRELADHATYLTCSSSSPSRPRRYRATSLRILEG